MSSPSTRRKLPRCSVPDCNKQAQTRKLCKAHGGGARCQGLNCTKLAQSKGFCVAHGGGRRCDFKGCNKLAQYKGLCLSHGGGRRCRVPDCQKFVQLRGYCKAHAKNAGEVPRRSDSKVWNISTVSSPPSKSSKFDVSFLMNPLESRLDPQTKIPMIQEAVLSIISQDPAVRIFTAPRPWNGQRGTVGSHC